MYDACVPWPERPKGAKDKSRGPKGLELEVGARRAPKLPVFEYWGEKCTSCIKKRLVKGFHAAILWVMIKVIQKKYHA